MYRSQKYLVAAVAAVAILWGLFVLAPAARADEASYINGIDSQGVPVTASTLALGHEICATVSALGVDGVTAEVEAALEAGVSSNDAAVIIVVAVYELCPSNLPVLHAWENSDSYEE